MKYLFYLVAIITLLTASGCIVPGEVDVREEGRGHWDHHDHWEHHEWER